MTNQNPLRSLPYDTKSEQMLLGSILINHELLNQVTEFLKGEHFFDQLHQKIFNAVINVTEKGMTPTQSAIRTVLDKEELFKEAGGTTYLSQLITQAITVINPYEYGKLIFDLSVKRSLITIGEEIVNNAYNPDVTYDATMQIGQAEGKLYSLAENGINERSFTNISSFVSLSVANIAKAMKNATNVTGISSGFIDMDRMLSGFQNSDLIILAGRPSMGKTAFAISLALNACRAAMENVGEKQKSVGFFSLEMSSEQIAYRLLSNYTGIDSSRLRSGYVMNEQYNDLYKASIDLSNLPLFIDDTPALSIAALRTKARKLKRKHNLGILFIDYLQLVKGISQYNNFVHEITAISQGLKAIAKELNIPVIALSQLSRAVETREDKRPMLSDLRESGSIEQDADIVMFIYREEYYLMRKQPAEGTSDYDKWQSECEKVKNKADIIIAKHRNGAIGNVSLFYDTSNSKFNNIKAIQS